MSIPIKLESLAAPGARRRLGRAGRVLGLALLLTLTLGLSGCAWFHAGGAAGSGQAPGDITPAGAGATEQQQYLEDAGPAVRFVGAGALQLPVHP